MASEGSLSGIRKRFIALISALHKVENKRVSSEKWNGKGGLTASKLPVSSNVKLIYPLIRWKTIEMSVHVIQPRAIETVRRDREGGFLLTKFSRCQRRYFLCQLNKTCNSFVLGKGYYQGKYNGLFYLLQCLNCHLGLSVLIYKSVSEFSFDTFDFKRRHRKKRLYLIWLQYVETKSDLMNSVDSQFTWMMFSCYNTGTKRASAVFLFLSCITTKGQVLNCAVPHTYLLLI